MMNRLILEIDDSVVLRQYIPEDAEGIFYLIDHSRTHLSQFGDTTAEKYPNVDVVRESILTPKNPSKFRFGIWDCATMVGGIGIAPYGDPKVYVSVEIGYWLGAMHQSKGYMNKAIRCAIAFAFENMQVCSVYGIVTKGDVRSANVFRRVGFVERDVDTELQFFMRYENYMHVKDLWI
jgi:RimJ/RimL family protein N-acetyltransferase